VFLGLRNIVCDVFAWCFWIFSYMETCFVTMCGGGQRPVLSLYVMMDTEQVSAILAFKRVCIVPKNAF